MRNLFIKRDCIFVSVWHSGSRFLAPVPRHHPLCPTLRISFHSIKELLIFLRWNFPPERLSAVHINSNQDLLKVPLSPSLPLSLSLLFFALTMQLCLSSSLPLFLSLIPFPSLSVCQFLLTSQSPLSNFLFSHSFCFSASQGSLSILPFPGLLHPLFLSFYALRPTTPPPFLSEWLKSAMAADCGAPVPRSLISALIGD